MPRLLQSLRYAWLTPVALLAACGGPSIEHVSHGRFSDVVLMAPAGAAAPAAVVLLVSGSEGWNGSAVATAAQLAQQGALVVGIDLPRFQAALNVDGGQCVYPAGDLENLSHFVQAYRHLPTYLAPILAGVGCGASLVHGALAQAPKDTFGGALSAGFCPGYARAKPLCPGAGKELTAPWVGVRDPAEWPAAFNELVARSLAARPAPQAAGLGDLPIVEVPAAADVMTSERFAVMLSGDGGWAGLDRDIATALAAQGIPVVGLDSLRYFWTARTPDGISADLGRIISHYTATWHRPKVLLIGYSQGADVLPFAVNRLDPAARAKVALAVVMGLSPHALFEFHLGNWLGSDDSGPATLPEMNRITGIPIVCIYGVDESDSLCPTLDPRRFTLVALKGGHHFDGDYAGLARRIIAAADLRHGA